MQIYVAESKGLGHSHSQPSRRFPHRKRALRRKAPLAGLTIAAARRLVKRAWALFPGEAPLPARARSIRGTDEFSYTQEFFVDTPLRRAYSLKHTVPRNAAPLRGTRPQHPYTEAVMVVEQSTRSSHLQQVIPTGLFPSRPAGRNRRRHPAADLPGFRRKRPGISARRVRSVGGCSSDVQATPCGGLRPSTGESRTAN